MNEHTLRKNGTTQIPYPQQLKEAVRAAAQAWEEFCTLPLEDKLHFATHNNFDGAGYEVKINDTVSSDHKENFDYTLGAADRLRKIATENEKALAFIAHCEKLGQEASAAITQFGQAAEDEGIDGFAQLAEKSAPKAFFRFLHYPAGDIKPGASIAEHHTDHSGFTLHLYESTDGCERLSFDGKTWQPLPVKEGTATAFGGMQTQLVSNGKIKALCHRVIANETTVNHGRYAVVCFIALEGVPSYDKATHGRLQEKPAGFNYEMLPADFTKLFKKLTDA